VPSAGTWNIAVIDYDGEIGTIRLHASVITVANFAAQDAGRTTVLSMLGQMTTGTISQNTWGNRYSLSVTKPSSPAAQRELKWIVRYHDTVLQRKLTAEIPCANTARLDPHDRGNAFIGDAGLVDAFKTVFEAFIKSPQGNAVVIDEITLVGRRV
jgi:hypothetical protein